MKYKDLEKILKILKDIPNEKKRDEAIRLMLQTANESITCKALQSLLKSSPKKQEKNIKERDETIFLKFKKQEISKMPERFRKEFILADRVVHCLKRKSGKGTTNYMIRYRRNELYIVVSSNDLEEAKSKFICKLCEQTGNFSYAQSVLPKAVGQPVYTNPMIVGGVSTNFHEFSTYYFENYRKRKVAPKTYANDMCRYKNHIRPYFGKRNLMQISPAECQGLLDSFLEKGMTKTNNEVYSLLNAIFKMAVAHNIITHNPMSIVVITKHQGKHGKALTKAEEKQLLDGLKGTKYEKVMALALYTGLRPNELATARVEGKFIVARNSKRKGERWNIKKYRFHLCGNRILKIIWGLTFRAYST